MKYTCKDGLSCTMYVTNEHIVHQFMLLFSFCIGQSDYRRIPQDTTGYRRIPKMLYFISFHSIKSSIYFDLVTFYFEI